MACHSRYHLEILPGRLLANSLHPLLGRTLRVRNELQRHRNLFLTPTINSFPRTYSMTDIFPSIDTRRIVQRKPIRILALDGGGIRGLSSLIFLRGLMQRVAVARDISSHEPATVRPSEYFDLIIGTGTGGLCALFLGRLRMTVDEAISAYQEVANTAFQPHNSLSRISPFPLSRAVHPALLSQEIEQCIGNIVQRHLHVWDAAFPDPVDEPHPCHTAVLAGTAAYIGAPPYILRSYATSEPPSPITIHEVARAAIQSP